jgi:hypothetical protein
MIFNLLFYIIMSVSFIFFIHQLYEYFKKFIYGEKNERRL